MSIVSKFLALNPSVKAEVSKASITNCVVSFSLTVKHVDYRLSVLLDSLTFGVLYPPYYISYYSAGSGQSKRTHSVEDYSDV